MMEGGTRVYRFLCLLLVFRIGSTQRFFNGIPGASRVVPGGAVPLNPGASRTVPITAGASRIISLNQESDGRRGVSLDQIDQAIESALSSIPGGRSQAVEDSSEDDISPVRGSARGAPVRSNIRAFGRARAESQARSSQPQEQAGQQAESRRPVRRLNTRLPSSQQADSRSTDSASQQGSRQQVSSFARSRTAPTQQRTAPTQQRTAPTQQRTAPAQQRAAPAQQDQQISSFSRSRSQQVTASDLPAAPISRLQESANTDASQTRFEEQRYVPRAGTEQIFDPSRNPLGDRKRPRLQQLQAPQGGGEQAGGAVGRLPNDFLPTCPDATFSYIIPSPTQCDLYYLCEFGTPSRKVCEDGLVFSIEQVKCVPAEIEDCKDRPLLQSPKGSGPCTRRNGIFYTNDTCTDFVTCRDNSPSFERCAEGLVFDPNQKICAWADEALRPGCMPEDLLGFRCPNPKLTQEEALLNRVHLKFGDHDRHADPTDCRYFFMCLTTGQPRRAGCGRGKVFDRASGICRLAKDVPECADYYGGSVVASGQPEVTQQTDARILRIQEDIRRQFASGSGQSGRPLLRNKRELMEEAEPEG